MKVNLRNLVVMGGRGVDFTPEKLDFLLRFLLPKVTELTVKPCAKNQVLRFGEKGSLSLHLKLK